ncbi:MAG: adenylyl-sulfate kinase [Lachnospiraceae bacterium]|nr:adenylyl-sulfate kinase [Lachnospiraceae bacterium]
MTGLLKFITCGSVDDGKSTLIGHMLYDAKLLYADQKRALELESRVGSRAGEIDYSLLLDGLMAEREQGITIDVAYRYFTTDNRSFIVADTPGHEEYTRNMAVGASFADLAVILVDAEKGVLIQTRRHTRICALMGIRYFVFAVNKMDLVDYDELRFVQIKKEIKGLASELNLKSVAIIPVSATEGDNVTNPSVTMDWYTGKTLLNYLETVDVDEVSEEGFVMPVQRVCRPDHTFRGFQGQIECGEIAEGDEITVLPSGETAGVSKLLWGDKEVKSVSKGQPVTICLDREIDVSRGCVFVKDTKPKTANLFTATILWMDDVPLTQGKSYFLKLGTKMIPATVLETKYRIDINSGEHIKDEEFSKNEIVVCDIAASEKIVVDKFAGHAGLGRFILVDRLTNMTSACGTVKHILRRSENLFYQEMSVDRNARAAHMNQNPVTIWFTGLSGAGKSTLANEVEKALTLSGKYTMSLDGDNVRMGLNRNLGFTPADRIENIRRIAEVAKLMNDAGLITLTSFISPFISDRESAREIIGEGNFIEVYVSTPLSECERRDVKGLYKKARNGEIPNFTGISSPYEPPKDPEITVDTTDMTIEEAAEYILGELKKYVG